MRNDGKMFGWNSIPPTKESSQEASLKSQQRERKRGVQEKIDAVWGLKCSEVQNKRRWTNGSIQKVESPHDYQENKEKETEQREKAGVGILIEKK